MNGTEKITREQVTPQAVLAVVASYGKQLGLKVKPHDLGTHVPKLCRTAGGELEQIQLLLGHASAQTTERVSRFAAGFRPCAE